MMEPRGQHRGIGPAETGPGPEHVEVAQAHHVQTVEVVEHPAPLLPLQLGQSIRGLWTAGVRLGRGQGVGAAVHGAATGEDQPALSHEIRLEHRIQHRDGPGQIGRGAPQRFLDRIGDPRHGRQMDHPRRLGFPEQAAEPLRVGDASDVVPDPIHRAPGGTLGQVVDADDLMAQVDQPPAGVLADEAVAPRDDQLHIVEPLLTVLTIDREAHVDLRRLITILPSSIAGAHIKGPQI